MEKTRMEQARRTAPKSASSAYLSNAKAFAPAAYGIATTLTDAKLYPASKMAELYYRRRSIELFYRDIKTTMHMEVLRTKSPAMIEKELLMHAIAYNAIRAPSLQSARSHQQELGRISFKGAVDLLRQWCHRPRPAMTSPANWPDGMQNCWRPSPACKTQCDLIDANPGL